MMRDAGAFLNRVLHPNFSCWFDRRTRIGGTCTNFLARLPYQPMPHDVFISYSHVDRVVAEAACAVLEAADISCWMAPRDITPGTEWAEAIADAIGRTQALVLIFSSHANASRQVAREVELSISKGIELIPLRVENVTPARAMAYYLAGVHWLDASNPPLDLYLQRLVATVSNVPQIAARISSNLPPTPKATLQPAPVRPAAAGATASTAQQHGLKSSRVTGGSIAYKFRLPLILVVLILVLGSPFTYFLWQEISEHGIIRLFEGGIAYVSLYTMGLAPPLIAIVGIALRLRNLDNKRAFLEEIILYPDRVSIPAGPFRSRLKVIRFSEIRYLAEAELWPFKDLYIHTDSGKIAVSNIAFGWGKFKDFRRRLYAACGISPK